MYVLIFIVLFLDGSGSDPMRNVQKFKTRNAFLHYAKTELKKKIDEIPKELGVVGAHYRCQWEVEI